MICFPNAKINVGLRIIKKRPDGFHNIESILCPVNIYDILEIIKVNGKTGTPGKCTLQCTGVPILYNKCQNEETQDENLCIKAYKLLDEKFDLPPVSIHLHKMIPSGAGLGGGSSDAAFALKLLDEMFSIGLSLDSPAIGNNKSAEFDESNLADFARQLGSDCAFFIQNKPVYAYEKGDKFKHINIDIKDHFIVLINPGIRINTAEAYSDADNKLLSAGSYSSFEQANSELPAIPLDEWKHFYHNDFEKIIFPVYPEIKKIKEKLYSFGALYASMSGSGSSVYGVFTQKVNLRKEFDDYTVWEGLLANL